LHQEPINGVDIFVLVLIKFEKMKQETQQQTTFVERLEKLIKQQQPAHGNNQIDN